MTVVDNIVYALLNTGRWIVANDTQIYPQDGTERSITQQSEHDDCFS